MEHTVQNQTAQGVCQNVRCIVDILARKYGLTELIVGRGIVFLHDIEIVLFLNQIIALPDSVVEQVTRRLLHVKDIVKLTDFICIEDDKILAAKVNGTKIIGILRSCRCFDCGIILCLCLGRTG